MKICRTCIVGLSLLLPAAGHAQEAAVPELRGVRGTVTTLESEPIAAATVDLHARGDSVVLGSAVTTAEGRFRLDSVPAGRYYLLIHHVGFGSARTVEFTVTGGGSRDLGPIRLDVAALEIEPIEVMVDRPDIVFEPDRTGYLVEALAGADGGVITDALRAIPEVELDFGGGVLVRGQSPAIYIDGRPAPMTGISLEAFLEQFPADQIERIEVIDNPSARFGAEGGGGIINIVLREGVELGVTGGLTASVGTRGERSLGGRASLQRGPWRLSGGLNTRWSDSDASSFTLRQNLLTSPTTYLRLGDRSSQSSASLGGMLDIRYHASDRMHLSMRLSGDSNDGDGSGLTETVHLDEDLAATLAYDRLSTSSTDGATRAIALGLDYEWEPRHHSLEIEAYGRWNDDDRAIRDEVVFDPADTDAELLPPWLTLRDDETDADGRGFGIEYERPLGERTSLDFGVSVDRDASSEGQQARRFDLPVDDPGTTAPDSLDVRGTSHRRIGRSAYLSLQRQLGRLGVQAGVRAESVRDEFLLPAGDNLDRSETRWFPSLNLSFSNGTTTRIRLGYSQRIERPGLDVLDPTDRSTDPLNRRVGNPDVESATTHIVTARLAWTRPWGRLSLGPSWTHTTDGWERVTTADEQGVSTTTWENVASRTRLAATATLGLRGLAGFGGFLNLSAGHSTVSGSAVTEGADDGHTFWSTGATLFRPVAGPVSAQGSVGYQPPRNLPQGRTSGQWTVDLGLRFRLMDDRMMAMMSFRDPFELQSSSREIRDPTVVESSRSSISSRSVSLSMSYYFGGGGRGAARRR